MSYYNDGDQWHRQLGSSQNPPFTGELCIYVNSDFITFHDSCKVGVYFKGKRLGTGVGSRSASLDLMLLYERVTPYYFHVGSLRDARQGAAEQALEKGGTNSNSARDVMWFITGILRQLSREKK